MSLDCCTRFAVPGMSSAVEDSSGGPQPRPRPRRLRELPGPLGRLPIRWRLGVTSAALTLFILMGFAVLVGALTTRYVQQNFSRRVASTADELAGYVSERSTFMAPVLRGAGGVRCPDAHTLADLALSEHAVIRYLLPEGTLLCQTPGAPDLGPPGTRSDGFQGYRVENRSIPIVLELADGRQYPSYARAILQYARRDDETAGTLTRVRLFLIVGVLAGAGLALLAGLTIGRRAMVPISRLTARASEIERTRDPRGRMPHPAADDEVAELARTLERMLAALDAARSETESALDRQRAFVADASHELRTPLTSVLANLELLEDELRGEQRETAEAALRSSRRMRRLVGDLLLLARADTGRAAPRGRVLLDSVLADAAAELAPVAAEHQIELDLLPTPVLGVRDELHRLALNLLENALRHTPPGTAVRAAVRRDGPEVVLEVSDDGPGVPPELAGSLFERFVRGRGERGGSSGLGLSIVRAVSRSHGGDVTLAPPGPGRGARFVVRLPAAATAVRSPDAAHQTPGAVAAG